jgi:hypothetical protein
MDNNKFTIPIVSYLYTDKYKSLILKENKNKSGVYKITNKVTNEYYVGSSSNIGYRFIDIFLLNIKKKKIKQKDIIVVFIQLY